MSHAVMIQKQSWLRNGAIKHFDEKMDGKLRVELLGGKEHLQFI